MLQLLLLLHLLLRYSAVGHVALTFPSARFPPLDFLDSARTISPCGVPKPDSPRYTQLYVGESYNFTWRLQYPHQGGYRLSVINETGDVVEQLAPLKGSKYVGLDDQTLQHATVRPTRPCTPCIVLLERQALEWGQAYEFRSCADVNIVQEVPKDDERCSKHGDYENGKCKCRHSYSGELCQYKDYCSTDDDCLNDGKCVKEANGIVRRTCYCSFGYFGQNCDRTFDAKPENDKCFNYDYPKDEKKYNKYGLFGEECFKKIALNENDFVYSRVVQDELEIILDYESTSWISIGWRPMEIDRSCRLFPDLENTRNKRDTRWTLISHSTIQMNESQYRSPIDLNLMPVPIPKLPENNGLLRAALLAPLHPMDCTDIVIGSVRDGRSRINDMYTRDRSTPLYDIWLDGEESFSAAYGIERDGRTIVMFRRRIAEIEPSDHPLGPGEIFVIYAKGQMMGSYSHAVKSALDQGPISDHNFYRQDEVKYHGNRNRGVHSVVFVSVDEQFPSIRPPLRSRHPDPSSLQHPAAAVHNSFAHGAEVPKATQAVSLPTTITSERSSSISDMMRRPSLHLNSKTEPTVKKESLLIQSEPVPEPEPELELEPKLNSREIDYLYFDNGSLMLNTFQLVYFFFFLFFLLSHCYL
ncbi:DOMON domain containing protein [Brugia malayi]|uniref:Bm2559 n=1 Tax=Brugia malayi TaxID=6279 RepID=A0A0I9R318_BRUMA|nr:DOMON domain containing protein [Brugia malayi]CTP81382.1 Bm2559 [Brugia malayi]VIO92847.1 DOMON domain containing protein [Brugia malayi]